MAKKSETPPIYCQRRGNGLFPEMQLDADAIARLPAGERIKLTLHTGRSPRKLRFYWSFLHKVVEATEAAPTSEALHSLIKLETGHTAPIKVKGYTVLVPASIAFENMSEEAFESFLQSALRYIAETFNVTPEMAFSGE